MKDPYEAFPVLSTRRLLLRQITPADTAALFELYSDPEVMALTNADFLTRPEQARELIESWKARYVQRRGIRWGVTLMGRDTVVGMCGFVLVGHRKLDLGYLLAQPYWRQGIMREAVSAILPVGFAGLDAVRIEATPTVENTASRALLRALGFVAEGVLRRSAYWQGAFRDLEVYSLLGADEFHADVVHD